MSLIQLGEIIIKRNNCLRYPTALDLDKLILFEYQAQFSPGYPNRLTRGTIEKLISQIIGSDQKTINRYLDCIERFIKSKTHNHSINYYQWDLTGLYETCLAKKEELKKDRLVKLELQKSKENARQRCKTCRNYLRQNGSCVYC